MQSTNKMPYIAKPVDEHGYVSYTDEENKIWSLLIERQSQLLQHRACHEFMRGLDLLAMPRDRVPQLPEISEKLFALTKWTLAPVPALISADEFFTLLANRQFPVATFIRRREDIDYIQEPDIFHEIFGHCPMLTHPPYADFVQAYGRLSLQVDAATRELLARLFFYTVEIGLIQTADGLRIYGGGILSSCQESVYALESEAPIRAPFDLQKIMSHSFRLDELQKIYFVIEDFNVLYQLLNLTF